MNRASQSTLGTRTALRWHKRVCSCLVGHFSNVKICVNVSRAHIRNDLEAVPKYLSLVVGYVFLSLVQYPFRDLGFPNK